MFAAHAVVKGRRVESEQLPHEIILCVGLRCDLGIFDRFGMRIRKHKKAVVYGASLLLSGSEEKS